MIKIYMNNDFKVVKTIFPEFIAQYSNLPVRLLIPETAFNVNDAFTINFVRPDGYKTRELSLTYSGTETFDNTIYRSYTVTLNSFYTNIIPGVNPTGTAYFSFRGTRTETIGGVPTVTKVSSSGITKITVHRSLEPETQFLETSELSNLQARLIAVEAVAEDAFTTENPPPIATKAEAEVGTVNNKYMTPLRTKEAIAAQVSTDVFATKQDLEDLELGEVNTINTVKVNNVALTIDAQKAVNIDLTAKADLVEGKIPSNQLPSFVDDVLEFANLAAFPLTGEAGKIYVALDTNLTYRWGGSTYVEISQSLALGETEFTAFRGDLGKEAYDWGDHADAGYIVDGAATGTIEALTTEEIAFDTTTSYGTAKGNLG